MADDKTHPDSSRSFLAAAWRAVLAHNGLNTFDDFWPLDVGWFERPNERRGGWSGVSRCELPRSDGSIARIFLKRQEDHVTRTLMHPVRGELTFACEFRNILRYQRLGIPTLTPVFFGTRDQNGKQQAVLVTEELVGFRALDDMARDWRELPPLTRHAIVQATGRLLRQIHSAGLTHNSFYPKHIFLRLDAEARVEARIIDLERTKRRWWRSRRDYRDMWRLDGAGLPWSRADRVRFFCAYSGVSKLTPEAKREWRRIDLAYGRKRRRNAVSARPQRAPVVANG
jgi:hypothetical protein